MVNEVLQAVVLFVYSTTHMGDVGHVKALCEHLPEHIVTHHVDVSKENWQQDFEKQTPKENKFIMYAVGEKGLQAASTLNLNRKRTFVAVSIHQYMKEVAALKPHYLALPLGTAPPNADEVLTSIPHVVRTFSVPTHNPSMQEIDKAYSEWNSKPNVPEPYIIVLLPGDAPDSDETMQCFTRASADDLAQNIIKLWRDLGQKHSILIHNGPRTGKHDPQTKRVVCTHTYREGENPGSAEDAISQHFVGMLRDQSIPCHFYNFSFIEKKDGTKQAQSVLSPLLYLTYQENCFFVLPGESVSMLGQMPLYVPGKRLIVFKPSSMNACHQAVCDAAYKQGYVSLFLTNGERSMSERRDLRIGDDAADVASKLLEAFYTFFK